MAKYIEVTLVVEIPDVAEEKDIKDFVDVHFAECNSMQMNNPIQDNYEIVEHYWEISQ
jgi:hypothetical protein